VLTFQRALGGTDLPRELEKATDGFAALKLGAINPHAVPIDGFEHRGTHRRYKRVGNDVGRLQPAYTSRTKKRIRGLTPPPELENAR
jgi:hypothetical protein